MIPQESFEAFEERSFIVVIEQLRETAVTGDIRENTSYHQR